MRRNPQLYGLQYMEANEDPLLTIRRKELILEAAKNLEKAQMIRLGDRTEYLHSTG
jgi:antiviral helicase SLH1